MARKYNERGSFQGIKVKLDDFSGEVNLQIPLRNLREILTAASLNCFDSLDKAKTEGRRDQAEVEAYHRGLQAYIKGIENFLEAGLSPETGSRNLGLDPLTRPRTVKERRATVKRAQGERKMFESLFSSIRAQREA